MDCVSRANIKPMGVVMDDSKLTVKQLSDAKRIKNKIEKCFLELKSCGLTAMTVDQQIVLVNNDRPNFDDVFSQRFVEGEHFIKCDVFLSDYNF
jgi:hypothetical protein